MNKDVNKVMDMMSPQTMRAWISDVAKETKLSELEVSFLEPFVTFREKMAKGVKIPKIASPSKNRKPVDREATIKVKNAIVEILKETGVQTSSKKVMEELTNRGIDHTTSVRSAAYKKLRDDGIITTEGARQNMVLELVENNTSIYSTETQPS